MANHIKGQLLRCSSSVAANYRATQLAQSTATFVSKISIVLEEADESEFWLKYLIDKKIIECDLVYKLHLESKELVLIFKKSRITAQNNIKNLKLNKTKK
jgi:four helix bundle protein